eukprot:15450653-Alexandrium_andersonii.AAC.1
MTRTRSPWPCASPRAPSPPARRLRSRRRWPARGLAWSWALCWPLAPERGPPRAASALPSARGGASRPPMPRSWTEPW